LKAGAARSWIKSRIEKGTVVNADESGAWNDLGSKFEMRRINHQEAYSMDGACTNMAESYFSRIRRGEIGHHHHVSGPYLLKYAQESAWREDQRRVDNGAQVRRVTQLALKRDTDFAFATDSHVTTTPKNRLLAQPAPHPKEGRDGSSTRNHS
jgi:hypothetical protein